jgi:hypothetical protein
MVTRGGPGPIIAGSAYNPSRRRRFPKFGYVYGPIWRNSRMARFIAIAALLTVVITLPAFAGTLSVRTVHFATCTQAGVEAGCIVAKGDDGKMYNVTSATRGVKLNRWLQGTGTISDRPSRCMQGSTIDNFIPDVKQKPGECDL